MRITDSIEYAYTNLRVRKLRSWLTILGIIIGVASIITLVSIANGVDQNITSRLSALGDNIIQVTPGYTQATRQPGGIGGPGGGMGLPGPGMGGGGGMMPREGFGRFSFGSEGDLTFDDAAELTRVVGVAAVDARIQGRVSMSVRGKNASVTLIGMEPSAFNQMSNTPVIAGRNLNSNDLFSAVLGSRVHANIFEKEDLLNRQISVSTGTNSTKYAVRVVGLLNESSGSMVVSDNAMYLPINVARTVLNQSKPSQFFVMTKKGYVADDVAADMEQKLLVLHHVPVDKPDFTITTATFLKSTIAEVTNLLALFLGSIASISLVVGGIGVANTMFMSVLERTREIGILKALGMKDDQIMKLFLFEAAAIGLVGGMVGVALSFGVSAILGFMNVPTVITLELILVGLFFSAGVGVVFGVVPARNAAKLEPVEALRYE